MVEQEPASAGRREGHAAPGEQAGAAGGALRTEAARLAGGARAAVLRSLRTSPELEALH